MSVREAEGLLELGMWADAWIASEALPHVIRGTSEVQRVRLACCPHLGGGWELGSRIASALSTGGDLDRKAVAEFYHAMARRRVEESDLNAAKEAAARAIEVSPTERESIIMDPALAGLL